MHYILDSEFPMLDDTTYYDIDDGIELEGIKSWASGIPFQVVPQEPIVVPITRIGESQHVELIPIPFNDANMCLANAEIASILSHHPESVALFRATLTDTDTQKEYPYFAINIINLVSKSQINVKNDEVSVHIARLMENKSTIVISAQLKGELKHIPYLQFRGLHF